MLTGYVYKIQNKMNGKIYVGQTVSSPLKRFDHHYSKGLCGCSTWQKEMVKFGKYNFELEVLCEVSSEDRLELRKKLIALENFFIDYYDSINIGYNKIKQTKVEKEIDYDISETIRFIETKHERIKSNYLDKDFKNKRKGIKPVFQYDKEGNFVKGFDSINEAERETGLNRGSIYNSCVANNQMSGGFIWRW